MGSATYLVFDGDCGFCTSSARWIARRLAQRQDVEVIAWQMLPEGFLHDAGLSLGDVSSQAWWIDDARRDGGARAVGRALAASRGPWALMGRAILLPPLSWFAAAGYRVVARYRYRLPGGTPACQSTSAVG